MECVIDDLPQLVAQIVHGDRAAEDALVQRFAKPVRLILLRRTRNADIASDLCQDTFVIALRRLRAGELQNPQALVSFVHRIAVNLSIEHFRKENRYVQSDDEIISLRTAHTEHKGSAVDQQRARPLLVSALQSLGVARDREILRRYFLEDEDKAIICEDLGLTPEHFDRVLYRAKQRMRNLLDQQTELKSVLVGSYLHD